MKITTPSKYAADLLQKARALIVLDQPFFASFILRKPIQWSTDVPTACVDARCNIYLNPEWIANTKCHDPSALAEPMTVRQLIFLLCHEAMHYMMMHSLRRGQRKPGAWNVACDAVINDTLTDANIGEFIDGGVEHPGARQFKAEDLYQEPPKGGDGQKPGDQPGTGGGGQGNPPPKGGSDTQPGGIGNDIIEDNLTDGEVAELEATTRVDVAQAAQAAKMQGKMHASLQRLVDEIIKVPTPWQSILERFMTAYRKDDYSWSRPNRRFIGSGVYLPGQNYVPEMGEVVIGVDTSGSIGATELAHFAGHINGIIEQCRPSKVHVVYCDSKVAHVDEYDTDAAITLTMHGGGGTDMTKIFDWITENGVDPDITVILTDLYTPFGDEPDFDVVWLSTTDQVAPYGHTVPYAIN